MRALHQRRRHRHCEEAVALHVSAHVGGGDNVAVRALKLMHGQASSGDTLCSGDHVKYWPYFVTRSPSRTSGHVVAIGHVNGKACASRSSSRLLLMSMDLGMVKNSFMACIALACPLVARLSFDPPLHFQRPCSRMADRLPPVSPVRAFYASTILCTDSRDSMHAKSYFMKLLENCRQIRGHSPSLSSL